MVKAPFVRFVADLRQIRRARNCVQEINSNRNKVTLSNLGIQAASPPLPRTTRYRSSDGTRLSHNYATNDPLVIVGRPTFAPKITPSRGPIPKPNYLPPPWIYPTYYPKPHPYPISRFATQCTEQRQKHTQ